MAEVLNRNNIFKMVGIGLYIAGLRISALVHIGTVMNSDYLTYLAVIAFVVGMVAVILANRFLHWTFRKTHVLIIAAIGSSALLTAYLVEPMFLIGWVISLLTFTILTMYFGIAIASIREYPVSLALSLILSVLLIIGLVELINWLFSNASFLLVAASQFLSALFLTRGRDPFPLQKSPGFKKRHKLVPIFALAAISIGYILCTTLEGMAEIRFSISSVTTVVMYCISAAVITCLLFLLQLSSTTRTGKTFVNVLLVLTVLLILGLLCFASILPINEESSYTIALACMNVFDFGFLILGPTVIAYCGLPFVPTYAILSMVCYGLFWRFIAKMLSGLGISVFSVGSVGIITVLFLLICLIITTNRYVQHLFNIVDDTHNDEEHLVHGQTELLGSLGQQYGITARELDVCNLLLQGYSASKIASKLFVSESTVRFHLKNVYHKMGIHSKQDLIDLVHVNTDIK